MKNREHFFVTETSTRRTWYTGYDKWKSHRKYPLFRLHGAERKSKQTSTQWTKMDVDIGSFCTLCKGGCELKEELHTEEKKWMSHPLFCTVTRTMDMNKRQSAYSAENWMYHAVSHHYVQKKEVEMRKICVQCWKMNVLSNFFGLYAGGGCHLLRCMHKMQKKWTRHPFVLRCMPSNGCQLEKIYIQCRKCLDFSGIF